jgi:hypothetical protein
MPSSYASSLPPSELSFNVYRATAARLREQLRDFMRCLDPIIAPFRITHKDQGDSLPAAPPVPPKDLPKDTAASTHRRYSSDDSPPPYSLSWLRTTVVAERVPVKPTLSLPA